MQADVPFKIDAAASNLDYYLEKSWTQSKVPLQLHVSGSQGLPSGLTPTSSINYDLNFEVCATDTFNGGETCSPYSLKYMDCSGLSFAASTPVNGVD